ncbi:MAG: hypothetical protein ABIA77_07285 [Candidatus Omnitrophota bacterium]
MFNMISRSAKMLKVPAGLIVAVAMSLLPAYDLPAQMAGMASVGGSGIKPPVEEADGGLTTSGNVTVNFKGVEIKTVLHYLSEVSGVDIIPSPGVDAMVTMRLRNKPWQVALDIVTRNYGFVYSQEGDIIRVIPKGQLSAEEPITEVLRLNNIIREIELTKTEKSEEIAVQEKEESISQLMSAINSLLDTKRGEKATFVASVNSIVVTAIPGRIGEVKKMLGLLDRKTPQVILDVKVIEITLNKDERFGVNWNAIITAAGAKRPTTFPFQTDGTLQLLPSAEQQKYYASSTALGGDPDFPFIVNGTINALGTIPAVTDLFTFGSLDFSTFTATLSLLKNRGDTEVISSPRITTLNNQKAHIKVVDKIMLQKTQETTQTAGIITVEFEKESDAREVGVILTVIPHVNENNEISVNLLPEVSTNSGFNLLSVGTAQTATISLTFSSREANTIVRVNDGETIFLGGLIRKNVTKTDNKLPILGDLFGGIPGIGGLFRYEAELVVRTELVFFVTVHLVKDGKDSIRTTRSMPAYLKYCQPEEAPEEGTGTGTGTEGPGAVIMTGKLSGKTEQVEVPVKLSDPSAGKKRGKPFLDFRKKK